MKYTALAMLGALALPAPAPAQDTHQRTRAVARVTRSIAAFPVVDSQRRGDREEQTERTTHTLKIGSSGELDISNIAGDIVVSRGGGSEATIEIVKTAQGRTAEDARQMLGLVQVEISERGGRGEVKTRYPSSESRGNRRNINVSVACNIVTPADTRLIVRSISGNIKVGDIRGDLSLETVSGTVDVSKATRISAAKSISGEVTIADSTLEGSAEAGSISGAVKIRGVQARRLNISSISSGIVIENTTAERIDAQTMSGDVEFQSGLSGNGRYELKSHSGNVQVTLTGNTGFELEANSWSGSVRADLSNFKPQGEAADGRKRRRTLRGTFGDGSAFLNITTFSGNVIVTRR
jgi:hypothetical protein